MHPRVWGHFLNAHYLVDLERAQKVRYRPGGKGGTAPYQLLNAGQFPSQTPGYSTTSTVGRDRPKLPIKPGLPVVVYPS